MTQLCSINASTCGSTSRMRFSSTRSGRPNLDKYALEIAPAVLAEDRADPDRRRADLISWHHVRHPATTTYRICWCCNLCSYSHGLATVIFGGVTIGRIASIDYAAPVVAIQKRVGAVGSEPTPPGQPVLWTALVSCGSPIFVLEMNANLGIDLFVTLPAFIWINMAIGVAGFVATAWYLRRRNARSVGMPDDTDVPRSLREAKGELEEISRFEKM